MISALLGGQAGAGGQANLAALLQGNLGTPGDGELSAFEPDGPKEERIIEVPARKKGHLLGLHGQTIEKIRQTSGVIKCHIMADRGRTDKEGSIQVQIFGTREHVEACQDLVERVVAGDHSGIGHASAILPVEAGKVNRLRGDHWQVINALKDLTSTYLDILQADDPAVQRLRLQEGGLQAGVQPGEAQLFIAGPHECVERAKTIVTTLLTMMDHVPANGEISPEALGSVLNALIPALPSLTAPAPSPAPTPTPSLGGSALDSASAGVQQLAGLLGSLAQLAPAGRQQAPVQQQGQYLEQLAGGRGLQAPQSMQYGQSQFVQQSTFGQQPQQSQFGHQAHYEQQQYAEQSQYGQQPFMQQQTQFDQQQQFMPQQQF